MLMSQPPTGETRQTHVRRAQGVLHVSPELAVSADGAGVPPGAVAHRHSVGVAWWLGHGASGCRGTEARAQRDVAKVGSARV